MFPLPDPNRISWVGSFAELSCGVLGGGLLYSSLLLSVLSRNPELCYPATKSTPRPARHRQAKIAGFRGWPGGSGPVAERFARAPSPVPRC